MALMSLDPAGKGRRRWTTRWKAPSNAFQRVFARRLVPAGNWTRTPKVSRSALPRRA
jgi:hypothetical protein